MADYLMPNGEIKTIEDKRYIFSIRNRMIQIPINFPLRKENFDENCKICGEKEKMEHLYSCKWGQEDITTEYEHIYGDNLRKIRNVYSQSESKPPRAPIYNPLLSVHMSEGN